jgi:hypothetical protein
MRTGNNPSYDHLYWRIFHFITRHTILIQASRFWERFIWNQNFSALVIYASIAMWQRSMEFCAEEERNVTKKSLHYSMQQRKLSIFHSKLWGHEGDHSPAAIVVVKNWWGYTSTLPCAFVA